MFRGNGGLHRYFTHGSFKAVRWLRIALAVAGSVAVEGEVIQWVADHRRHHAYADREGDPHSPWRYGASVGGLLRGLLFADCGWLFAGQSSNRARFAPDLLADRDIVGVDRLFLPLVAVLLLAPSAVGGLLTWSWQGALTAFFWGSLVRLALLHHVTWSINLICQVYGQRPFKTHTADRAANFWPLALLSFGESWHNSHHADLRPPWCAARPGRPVGAADLAAGEGWLGLRRGLAQAATVRRAAPTMTRRARRAVTPAGVVSRS